jgi:hypothetical protein
MAPSLRTIMQTEFSPEERDYFESRIRPALDVTTPNPATLTYLTAEKI